MNHPFLLTWAILEYLNYSLFFMISIFTPELCYVDMLLLAEKKSRDKHHKGDRRLVSFVILQLKFVVYELANCELRSSFPRVMFLKLSRLNLNLCFV